MGVQGNVLLKCMSCSIVEAVRVLMCRMGQVTVHGSGEGGFAFVRRERL